MKPYPPGIIRTIDSSGKITIPKDFRSKLNIQEQNPVEISLLNDAIVIRKYQQIQKLSSLCEDIIHSFSSISNAACVITGTEYALVSKGISILQNQSLSKPIQNLILQAESYIFTEEEPLYLLESERYRVGALFPIGTVEHPIGAFILIHYRSLSTQELHCARLLASYLTTLSFEHKSRYD